MRARTALVTLLFLATGAARAACPDAGEVDAFVKDFESAHPSRGLPSVQNMEDARCAQAAVVRKLTASLGPVAGYKAGLTNPAMQKRLGVDQPVSGVLLKGMLLPDGSEFKVASAARPLYEADFIMVVKDGKALARARSLQEAAQSIAYVVPFIELPDLMLDPSVKLTGPGLVAINAGARYGVLGTPIAMQVDDGFIQSLATMTVVLLEDGHELAKGPGSAILDNPLNSAMWLARDLAGAGIELKAGDMLSLGSFLPAQPPKAGTKGTARYVGLPGDPTVSVTFR
jgi:2-keto-4-pentenoate hydratase